VPPYGVKAAAFGLWYKSFARQGCAIWWPIQY